MRTRKAQLVAISLFLTIAFTIKSQTTVTTDPVGFTSTSCLGNSDTYLGIPFTRPPEFTGTVQSVSGKTLTINGTPGWPNNRFVYAAGSQPNHYYLLIGNGGATNPKEGHTYAVTSNGSNTLTVDTSFDNLTGVVANTQVTVIPYWTPATLFPASDATVSFTPTTSSGSYQTQLRIPNSSAAGINLPYSAIYFFSNNVDGTSNNVGWRLVGDNTTSHDDDPLLPDSYLVVRNQNGAPTLPFTALGSVLMGKVVAPLLTTSTQQQDNAVAMIRPVDVTLDSDGLAPIDNSFVQGDQLLLFNNAQAGFDKLQNGNYATFTFDDGWRLTGDAAGDHGKDLIPAGSALLVRKASVVGAKTSYWTNNATYVPRTGVALLAAGSRKKHGSTQTAPQFEVNFPIVDANGIECRVPDASNNHQIVFTFANPVTVASTMATPSSGTASVVGNPVITRHQIAVNLTATNGQTVLLTLYGVNDGNQTADITIPIGILLGDVNASRHVDGGDVFSVQRQNSQAPTLSNFRNDVNNSGHIDGGDLLIAQRNNSNGIH